MAVRFDSGDSLNNFFNTSLGKNRANNGNNLFNSINLNDYYSLKTGTYKKLLNSYFEKNMVEDGNSKETSLDKLMNDKLGTDKLSGEIMESSEKINKTLDELSEIKYDEANRSKIEGNINKLVSSYNNVLDKVDKSNDQDLETKAKWMTNYTKGFQNDLENVGIKIGDDNKLEVEKDVLKKANLDDIKQLFVGKSSFGENLVTISAIDTYL